MTRRKTPPPKLTSSQRRQKYALRRVGWVLATAAVLLAIYLGDQHGIFGRPGRQTGADYTRYNGKSFQVTHVVDGDTIDVDEPDRGGPATRVRLWGVDTPETKAPGKGVQHFGPEATAFTSRLCEGKTVRLELIRGKTRGKYGRLLAYVELPDGMMLNRELIRQGYGYADPRFHHPRETEFQQVQAQARAAGTGLWKNAKPRDLPYYMSN